MTPYLNAVRQEPLVTPVHSSSLRARTHPGFRSHDVVDAGRHGPGQRRKGHDRPRPQLVHDLPARPLEGRIPARQHLGRRSRVSAPMLVGGGRSYHGRRHNVSWCMTCCLALWRDASRHTSTSAAIDGLQLLTPMGGRRSSIGRRCIR
jgi:hypothetical protein